MDLLPFEIATARLTVVTRESLAMKLFLALQMALLASQAHAGPVLWRNIEAGMPREQVQALYPAAKVLIWASRASRQFSCTDGVFDMVTGFTNVIPNNV